jgi:hypothetical protein
MPMPLLAALSFFDFVEIVLGIGMLFVLVLAFKSQDTDALSHWYQLIDGLQYSTQTFYEELDKELELRKIPKVHARRFEHPEGAPYVSPNRLYLRVQRDDLIFDVCFAEFGRACFVSWWLIDPPGCFARFAGIPFLGIPFRPFIRPTYYRIDTQLMFQDVVHAAVLKVLDDLIKVNNLKELTVEQRKPIMKEFFKR